MSGVNKIEKPEAKILVILSIGLYVTKRIDVSVLTVAWFRNRHVCGDQQEQVHILSHQRKTDSLVAHRRDVQVAELVG